jgi:RimJ/RimL family protein N-acetyltransferase
MLNPYLIGKNIYLRSPIDDDIEIWHQWFNDKETNKHLAHYYPNTIDKQKIFLNESRVSESKIVLMICLKSDDKILGVCSLNSINLISRSADIALVVGDKLQKKGIIAIESFKLLLEIAFKNLNLLNIKSFHNELNNNTTMLIKMFDFEEVGRFKKIAFSNGEFNDDIISQLSKDNWLLRQ